MKLKELGEQLGKVFMVDETLKIYCYKNKIEFIDYTAECETIDGIGKIGATYGHIVTCYIENNKIIYIEHCIGNINSNNKLVLQFLLDILGQEIEDYNEYKKLPSIKELESIDINLI